jgi:hypothetical protein
MNANQRRVPLARVFAFRRLKIGVRTRFSPSALAVLLATGQRIERSRSTFAGDRSCPSTTPSCVDARIASRCALAICRRKQLPIGRQALRLQVPRRW